MLTQSRKVAKKKNRDAVFCLSFPLCGFAALREMFCWAMPIVCACLLTTGKASAQPEKPTRVSGDKAIEARRILKTYCGECHGKNPTSLPAGSQLSILDHGQLISPPNPNHPLPFVVPKNAKTSHLIELIECGSMPPGGKRRPSAEEIARLRDWIETSAPAYPAEFDNRYVLEQILADYDRLPPEEMPFYRYASFAHLIVNDQPDPKFAWFTQRSLGASFTLAAKEYGAQVPIDGTATVYRLDLRKTGFLTPDLFYNIEDQKPKGVAPITPFDLVLIEYPYGFVVPDADPLAPRLKTFVKDSRLYRPIPFLRGDWLAYSLAEWPQPMLPDLSPLGREVKDLVDFGNSLKGKEPLKASEAELFKNAKSVVAMPTPEGWLPIPPLSAVYSGDVSAATPPFNLRAEIINPSGDSLKQVTANQPFQMRLTADKPVFFMVIRVMPEGEIRLQPVTKNMLVDTKQPLILRPKDSTGGAFNLSLPDGKTEAMEHFIILASETDIPATALQFVRSKHRDSQLFRFLFDPPDPTKVVRKVLPLKVTDK